MRNLFLGSVALLLLGTPFVYTWRITRIEIRVLEGLCLLVMCLYVKGQLPISRLWHLWVRECYFCGKSNFWGICQLFIWRVYDVMLAWPLSMFSLAILIFNRFFSILATFHPCCLFLRWQRMHLYRIQLVYCLFGLSNLQKACRPRSVWPAPLHGHALLSI